MLSDSTPVSTPGLRYFSDPTQEMGVGTPSRKLSVSNTCVQVWHEGGALRNCHVLQSNLAGLPIRP